MQYGFSKSVKYTAPVLLSLGMSTAFVNKLSNNITRSFESDNKLSVPRCDNPGTLDIPE